ncbi:hypothetical protein PR048_017398 [Dryococelus australis]|uniref:Uncharacterized protein n=1 Tax=Dryococelus australis TaxID=614101 RepID=A0ABQ9H9G9_9NEOP|nr:hypothetical protein PR048_017398 [Dryococelus australis]
MVFFLSGTVKEIVSRIHLLWSIKNLGRGAVVVRLLALHQGEPGSISGGVTPSFYMWESCRTMPLAGGFSRGSPVSFALAFRRCSILTSLHPHRSRPNLFTHSINNYTTNKRSTSYLVYGMERTGSQEGRSRNGQLADGYSERQAGFPRKGNTTGRDRIPATHTCSGMPTATPLLLTPRPGCGLPPLLQREFVRPSAARLSLQRTRCRERFRIPNTPLLFLSTVRLAIHHQCVLLRYSCWGRGCAVTRALAPYQGEPRSIPGGATPGLSLMGIVPDDTTGRRVFSGIYRFTSPCIPELLHTYAASPSSTLKSFPNLPNPLHLIQLLHDGLKSAHCAVNGLYTKHDQNTARKFRALRLVQAMAHFVRRTNYKVAGRRSHFTDNRQTPACSSRDSTDCEDTSLAKYLMPRRYGRLYRKLEYHTPSEWHH